MRYQRSPGTEDYFPETTAHWQWAEGVFRDVCDRFGYGEIRTPLFEPTELFERSVGVGSDIVEKEMYTFEDRGGRSLTLRAEGTAPVIRAYIEGGWAGQRGVQRFYYLAAVFRYERKQKGRYRQHHQAGIELLGAGEPQADVEVLHLGWTYLTELGLQDLRLELNSVGCPACRPVYREALAGFLAPRLGRLCQDCQRRYEVNILRVLDCKNEGCQAITRDAPEMVAYLCPDCAAHFEAVQGGVQRLEVPFHLQPRLVRGLDYYTRTAFEVSHPALGSQNVVLGGGRYDGLIELCGGPPTPGIGFGSGLERALLALQATAGAGAPPRRPLVFITALTAEERAHAQAWTARLRAQGFRVETDLTQRSLKAQMREANRQDARIVIFMRDDLLQRGLARVKWMADGREEDRPITGLTAYLCEHELHRAGAPI